VDNSNEDDKKGSNFSTPDLQYHFNAVRSPHEEIYERQQEQAKSQMVFQPSKNNQKSKDTIAVLDESENPFEHRKKLDSSFVKSKFYKFIEELADECGVTFKYTINQKTFDIPVVDFHPFEKNAKGFRLVCADLRDNTMAYAPYNKIATSIPFSFRDNKNEYMSYRYSVLYGDSITFRESATFEALAKFINPGILNYDGKRILLDGNLNVQYTDYNEYLREFDEDYSPFPDGKPKNGQLGIIASWVPDNDINSKDILRALTALENTGNKRNLSSLEGDCSYLVCAIRYIQRINKDIGRIIYTITEYTEIGNSLIADGLYQCIKALLKEYCINYPNMKDRTPHIIIELDPNNYPSPSVNYYIERGTLLPMDNMYKANSLIDDEDSKRFYVTNQVEQHLRYCYIQKREFRLRESDVIRKDLRKFNAPGLIRMMPEEIKAAGLQRGIYDRVQRNIFIANQGYVKATQLEIKEYFVHQKIVQQIMMDGSTLLMNKKIDPNMIYNQSGIVDNSNNGINSINSAAYNPAFAMQMNKIEKGRVTPEAMDFYNSYLQQKQQQAMAEMYYQNTHAQMPVGGVWQGYTNPYQNPAPHGIFTMPRI
jgi:hypothetical protein